MCLYWRGGFLGEPEDEQRHCAVVVLRTPRTRCSSETVATRASLVAIGFRNVRFREI